MTDTQGETGKASKTEALPHGEAVPEAGVQPVDKTAQDRAAQDRAEGGGYT